MISVHAIRGGSPGAVAEYYLRPKSGCERELAILQAAGPAEVGRELQLDPDYYLNRSDGAGRWIGGCSQSLGLEPSLGGPLGEQSRRAFLNALYGDLDGVTVAKPVTRYDEHGTKIDVRVAAYDVTISAPKSVSTLMALAPSEVAQKVLAAHGHAATEAIALLEQLSARAARGHHGDGQRATRIATDGFLAAAFDHTTSRAHDPQLHTHVVVMNLVRGEDAKWSALDSRTLHRQATIASYLYQHLLRAELTRELGVAWEPVERGVAEIAGIPKSLRREFATRRAQIEAALRATDTGNGLRGRTRTLAAKAACLATRPAKTPAEPSSLRQDWAARAKQHRFGPERVEQLLAQQHIPEAIDRPAVSARVLGGDGATRERPTFDQGTVLRELIAALPPGTALDREELLGWTRQLMNDAEVVPVANSEIRTFTTGNMLGTEQRLLTLASRADPPLAVVPAAQSLSLLMRSELRPEQRDVAQVLLGSGRPVEVVSGPAGSGKTRGLAAAVTVWQTHGVQVRGTAVAALTAHGLQDATGAESVSLTRLLNKPATHVPEQGVLLVDEAGMIGTRQLLRLLTVAQQRACTVVLVGDAAQLPELEAGGAFAALTRQPTALQLDGHGRQKDTWEQHALHDLRNGRPAAALDAYQERDRLHLAVTRDELHAGLVRDYLRQRSEHTDPWQVAVLAARRRDVADLNTLIRHQLVADGVLGRRRLRVETPDGSRDYCRGDQVIVARNHHDRQLLNGTRGTVRTVRRDGLVLQLTDGRKVVLDKTWLRGGDLDHGYAMTLHKAQGRTVHTSLVLADETLSQEGGYVGLSRGTTANHLYLDASSEHALRDCVEQQPARSSATDAARLTRALSRSLQQRLANELLEPSPAYGVRPPSRDRSEGLSR